MVKVRPYGVRGKPGCMISDRPAAQRHGSYYVRNSFLSTLVQILINDKNHTFEGDIKLKD
jgi:hypothetical protein